VVGWGCEDDDWGQCDPPSPLCGVTAIAAGPFHSLAACAIARCTVPTLVGMQLARAKLAITRGHCRTGTVSYTYSGKSKGTVVSQSRRGGQVLAADSKVDLVVSRGRK
jgi:hypothetical protein